MDIARVILIVLHVAFAAVAFAVPLGMPGSLKRARAHGPEAFLAAAQDARRRDMLAGITWLLTLITGVAPIFVNGGFKAMPPHYPAANGLVILVVAFGFLFIRPAVAGVVKAAEAHDDTRATSLIKRIAMGSGIVQLVWLVTLVLMFWHLMP